jgi:hypothetical protein
VPEATGVRSPQDRARWLAQGGREAEAGDLDPDGRKDREFVRGPQEDSGWKVLLILGVVGGLGVLGLIVAVVVAAVFTLGQNASSTFSYVATTVSSGGGPAPGLRAEVKGYTPGKTPNEALDKFREACKNHDYKAAARYCTGEYLEQIDKAAEPASELGKEAEALTDVIDRYGIDSKMTKDCMKLLEPFPSNFDIVEVKADGDTATAVIKEAEVPPGGWGPVIRDLMAHKWMKNPTICRSLSRGVLMDPPARIELVAVQEGGQKVWKIKFPVTPDLRQSVGRLCDKWKNYKQGLEKVKLMVRSKEIITREDLEAKMANTMSGAE